MRKIKRLFIIIIWICLTSCVPTRSTSIIYSDSYDKRSDQTSVTIFPYGAVKIPGQWTKTKENRVGGQYFFIGKDSVIISIALSPWDEYEFSSNNREVTPGNFVRKFYEWDSNYLKAKTNGQVRIVKEDRERNYLIWNIKNEQGLNDYFLFGLKGKIATNFYVSTNNWDEERKINFLELLFN